MDQQLETSIREGLHVYARLPGWLVNTRDPRVVSEVLARTIPEFASGRLRLRGCEIGHIRYKALYWSVLYELDVENVATGEVTRVVLQGKVMPPGQGLLSEPAIETEFGSDNWHAVIPELHLDLRPQEKDTILDSLDVLIHPERARQFLEEQIRKGPSPYHDIQILSTQPNVVRYKPGSRCTILYPLDFANGAAEEHGWPDLVVAKTYRGDKGGNAFEGMQAIWNSPLGSGKVVTVAEPLAYAPEMRVLLQGPIREEKILKDLIEDAIVTGDLDTFEQVRGYLKKVATGLAALHSSGISYGRTYTWKDERGEIRDRVDRLAEAIPELATSVDPLLGRLSALAAIVPVDPLVPSHGSFRPAQVLLNHGEIGFIDFDSFSQSEPGLDLALFLSTILNLAVTVVPKGQETQAKRSALKKVWKERYDQYLAVCDEFIDEYEKLLPAHLSVSRERVALWETLDILMLVLHCWIKNKTSELDPTLFLLDQYMQTTNIIGGP